MITVKLYEAALQQEYTEITTNKTTVNMQYLQQSVTSSSVTFCRDSGVIIDNTELCNSVLFLA